MNKILTLALVLITVLTACTGAKSKKEIEMKPAHVVVKQIAGKYRLVVNGEEFYVKGAGCEFGSCESIAAHGGNSFRTWRTDNGQVSGREVLDRAHEKGLMVLMGIDVARERHGFDYNDEVAVQKQLDDIRRQVMELKDHPALLAWGIGNELNLRYTNKKVWDAVEGIAKMIKEVDGNHPTTTMLAGISKAEVDYIREHCPNIDFLSIQMYGDVINLQQRLLDAGYDGPYLVTEWGATGHWEVAQTEWGIPIEQTSSEKADAIKLRYERAILADSARCMGSYVFLWGQKQERTPSWYGLFTEYGERTEAIDVMEYFWTGNWPSIRTTRMNDFRIDGKGGRFDNVRLTAGGEYSASLEIGSVGETPTLRVEIMPEPTKLSDGGDFEQRPVSIEGLVLSAGLDGIKFKAPSQSGPYRIFVYVLDGKGRAATANIPFFVN